jgi:hypothetical protein
LASQFVEGKDFEVLANGQLVMTAHYLQQRGFCCGNGCLNCPYDYRMVPEPKRAQLLKKRNQKTNDKRD